MAYATLSDVSELNTVRTFTASSKPNSSQVAEWLDLTAAELDGILRGQQYSLPIPTTATSALRLLAHGNALGAAAFVEQGSPTQDRRDMAVSLWREFKKALGNGTYQLDADKDTTTALVRTTVTSACAASPAFSIGMNARGEF